MQAQTQGRIATTIVTLAGIVALTLPLFITIEGSALVSLLVSGVLLTVLGLAQVVVRNSLPSILGAFVAGWIIISAFVYSLTDGVTISLVVTGAIAFLASLWGGYEAGEQEQYQPLAH